MRTVHTAPHGFADVVLDGGLFKVRERRADGTWICYNKPRYTSTWKARAVADSIDSWVEGRRAALRG